jgi:TetR/AcrR family transcriptional regulator, transcriptional repressor for nem operon
MTMPPSELGCPPIRKQRLHHSGFGDVAVQGSNPRRLTVRVHCGEDRRRFIASLAESCHSDKEKAYCRFNAGLSTHLSEWLLCFLGNHTSLNQRLCRNLGFSHRHTCVRGIAYRGESEPHRDQSVSPLLTKATTVGELPSVTCFPAFRRSNAGHPRARRADFRVTCGRTVSLIKETDRSQRSCRRPMRKGDATRERIVVRTADLLNAQGYRSTPVSEIMRAAGLQKGGIYRHFESRAALTLEAFEFAFARMRDRLFEAAEGKATAKDKLFALFEVARRVLREEAFHGGCPVMNLAVESDDADPELRDAARGAMMRLIGFFERIIADGMKRGEFSKGNARARATLIVASVEGAIMLTNLYKDGAYMNAVLDHLEASVRTGFR